MLDITHNPTSSEKRAKDAKAILRGKDLTIREVAQVARLGTTVQLTDEKDILFSCFTFVNYIRIYEFNNCNRNIIKKTFTNRTHRRLR